MSLNFVAITSCSLFETKLNKMSSVATLFHCVQHLANKFIHILKRQPRHFNGEGKNGTNGIVCPGELCVAQMETKLIERLKNMKDGNYFMKE